MLGKADEMNNVWRNRFCHISLNQNARACKKGESVILGKSSEMTAMNNVWRNRICHMSLNLQARACIRRWRIYSAQR